MESPPAWVCEPPLPHLENVTLESKWEGPDVTILHDFDIT